MVTTLQAAPLYRTRWFNARWLIIAPHADDETLGCGALIHDTAARRKLAGIVFLTDGAGSHSCATSTDSLRLAAIRRREARAAVRILADKEVDLRFLNWPDANPHLPNSRAFKASVQLLARMCDSLKVDAIAVTANVDPHCDHKAAYCLAEEVAKLASRRTAIFQYIVWAKASPGPHFQAIRTAPIQLGLRRSALAQHRSQMTPILGDGFLVPRTMRPMRDFDILYTRR